MMRRAPATVRPRQSGYGEGNLLSNALS
jgi:hypothetical protein